jgi:hypothetical protein
MAWSSVNKEQRQTIPREDINMKLKQKILMKNLNRKIGKTGWETHCNEERKS